MRLTRRQLRRVILNEIWGFGKKEKTGVEGYLESLRKKDLDFKSVDDVIKTKDGKYAAIGKGKSRNPQIARDKASIDAQQKIANETGKDASRIGGSKANIKNIDGVTYMTLVAH